MSVRFKFRSSVDFDSVNLDGKPSISVADLKSKIIRYKHLPICHDFDLLFSDAVSGQEFRDENFQIPSGANVIIKRVPAGSVQSDIAPVEACGHASIKNANRAKTLPRANLEVDNFDDFGAELCPFPEATECGSDLDVDKKIYFTNEMANIEFPRRSKMVGCQKLEASDLSEAVPRGLPHIGEEGDPAQLTSKFGLKEYTKTEKVVTAHPLAMQSADFPSELKCPLCHTYFKEAVMIPCCQHSFCERCIHLVLVDKGRCPKCLSTKCSVEDLLPNVSLRQAIERFLQSQILIKNSDHAFDQYAPDGESGIQAKEASYAVSVDQREAELPHSPSATGKGSNYITAELVGGKSAFSPQKLKQVCEGSNGSNHAVDFKSGPDELVADFQGENQPLHEEESTSRKKRAMWVSMAGANRSYLETTRQKRGDRACYMCGSPDHFIRDCPAASRPHPFLASGNAMFPGAVPGYASPYWNGTPFPQMRPFVNPFGNPGIMPYNATMMPVTSFRVPPYTPSMFGSMSVYRGFPRMGGVPTPVGTNSEGHLVRSECGNLPGCEKRQKLSNQDMRRGEIVYGDDGDFNKRHHCNGVERSHVRKSNRDKEESVSFSEDSSTQRSHRRNPRYNDHFDDELDRSSSEVEDMPSSSHRHSDEWYESHHRNYKRHNGRRAKCGSGSSQINHCCNEEKGVKRKRIFSDVKRGKQKHQTPSDCGLEPSFTSDQKTQQQVKDSSHGSRHSRRNSRSLNSKWSHERWQMVSNSDEDGEEDYRNSKRKRV